MTLLTMGLAEELRDDGISAATLWPQTSIATAAVEFAIGKELLKQSRTPRIMAEAALEIIKTEHLQLSGQTLIDEGLLKERGFTDFEQYKYDPNSEDLMRDLFLDE
jgi:citronellol/citronellal dehydrogenase